MSAEEEYTELAKVATYSHATLDRVRLHIEAGDAITEIDRLRAEKALLLEDLNEIRTVIPADFLDSLDEPSPDVVERFRRAIKFDSHGHAVIHPVSRGPGPIETMTVDITQDHDVRAGKRRLVEMDYAGNVVCEFVEDRPPRKHEWRWRDVGRTYECVNCHRHALVPLGDLCVGPRR